MTDPLLKVAIAQISPVWLDKTATLEKVNLSISEAAGNGAEMIVFGEGLIPGYPWWLSITHSAAWDNKVQKEIHAHYVRNAVQIESGDLKGIQGLAKKTRHRHLPGNHRATTGSWWTQSVLFLGLHQSAGRNLLRAPQTPAHL